MPANDSIYNMAFGVDSLSNIAPQAKQPTIVIIKDTIVNVVENAGASNFSGVGGADLDISILLIIIILGL